jgi:hypothetical protein
MALTYSTAIANAKLDVVESTIGTSAILKIRTGAPPSTVAGASTGTVLATVNLPSDWMAAASARSKSKSGTWTDTAADATGTAGHFEITASDGTTVGMRGTVGTSSADMIVNTTSFVSGDAFSVTTFTLNAGN